MSRSVRMRPTELEIPHEGCVIRCQAFLTEMTITEPSAVKQGLGSASFKFESTGPVTTSVRGRRTYRRQRPIVPRPAEFWYHR